MNKNIIFGINAVFEAINNNNNIDKILVKRNFSNEQIKKIIKIAKEKEIHVQHISQETLNKITKKNTQGILAIVSKIDFQNIYDIVPTLYEQRKNPFVAILDGITDTGNMGAIIRSAVAFKVNAIVIKSSKRAAINENTIKNSAGAIFKMPICRHKNLSKIIKFLKESGLQIISISEKSNDLISNYDFSYPTAIILGDENKGISSDLLRSSDKILKIPISTDINSLNVSVAAAITMYEVQKQRNK